MSGHQRRRRNERRSHPALKQGKGAVAQLKRRWSPIGQPVGSSRNTAAEIIGCHVRTVDRLLRNGRLKGYRVGTRKIMVFNSSIDQLLKEGAMEFE
jgi:excisionase family DNA binding protein